MVDARLRRNVIAVITKWLGHCFSMAPSGFAQWIAQSIEHHVFMQCGRKHDTYCTALKNLQVAMFCRSYPYVSPTQDAACQAAQRFKDYQSCYRDKTNLLVMYKKLITKIKTFPLAKPDVSTKRKRRCSVCRATWHDKRTCPEQPANTPTCPICLTSKTTMALKCGHVFCGQCLDKLQGKQTSITCPQCRVDTTRMGKIFI